jgi:hypothetical protein
MFVPTMSIHRIQVALHCWPSRRPARQGPGRVQNLLPAEPLPADRIELLELALEGQSIHDVEVFDQQLLEGLAAVAKRILAIRPLSLDDLRAQGYTTRLEISLGAEPAGLELTLPPELIDACAKRGLGIQITHDQLIMFDPDAEHTTPQSDELEDARR